MRWININDRETSLLEGENSISVLVQLNYFGKLDYDVVFYWRTRGFEQDNITYWAYIDEPEGA